MLLEVKNLTKRFGGFTAVSKVDLAVQQGEVRGIIGPNGSGKSTLFNLISGVYKPEPGASVMFDGAGHHRTRNRTRSRGSASRAPSRCCASSRA